MKLLFISFALIVIQNCWANPSGGNGTENSVPTMINRSQVEEGFLRKLNTKCSQRDNHSCVMLKFIKFMDRMMKKSSIGVGKGFELTQSRNTEAYQVEVEDDAILARASSTDEDLLSVILAEKLWHFVQSRSLRWNVHENADVVVSTEPKGDFNIGLSIKAKKIVDEGRGKMKNMGPLIAAAAAKIGLLVMLTFKGLVLLVGKALLVSKVALLLAVLIGVKKLLSKKSVTYEVVAQPHSHDSHSSGWGRAVDGFLESFIGHFAEMSDSQNLAFAGQKP